MTDDKPVFKPIPQRKKFPSFRYVEPKPRC